MKTIYIERSAGQGRDGDWVERLDLGGVERIVVGTGPGSFAGIRSAIAFAQGFALGRRCKVFGLPSPCAVAAKVFASIETVPIQPKGTVPMRQGSVPMRLEPTGTVPMRQGSVPMRLAVVGDARCGKIWIALFNGFSLEKDVFQVDKGEIKDILNGLPGEPYRIVTTDEPRIGSFLAETFGGQIAGGQTPRYLGGQTPDAEGLRIFAEANPSILKPEPLPIYLNPAVRKP